MSISILKKESESCPLSTSIYVRTLRSYSLVQFMTYGPLITFNLLSFFGLNSLSLDKTIFCMIAFETLATLSGFFHALIFAFQGVGNLKTPVADSGDNNLEENLTIDMTV